jgi:hypothetical protein
MTRRLRNAGRRNSKSKNRTTAIAMMTHTHGSIEASLPSDGRRLSIAL